jgi:hypothetical protein
VLLRNPWPLQEPSPALLPEPSQWRGPKVLPEAELETSGYWACAVCRVPVSLLGRAPCLAGRLGVLVRGHTLQEPPIGPAEARFAIILRVA